MSSGADDLEDGEIFDDDEPVEVFKGGGVEKPPVKADSPPKEAFKIKNSSVGGDRKKNNKDKRSSSNDRRDKRNDSNNRNSGVGKRKRGRESEDDHRGPTKNKQRKTTNEKSKSKDKTVEEIDENEMVYVMGGNSPTSTSKPMEWDNNTMYSDEEEGDKDNERGSRGRRGRDGFNAQGRMSRRARLGRGGIGAGGAGNTNKRNRFANNRKQNNEQAICKFFLQGKCQRIRGNDCPYSHGTVPTKKMELCKFYMNDCCTKRDKCMYMHGDFPCKFYHTGQKCYAGKRCKFYHGKISNFLRSVLMKHLENRELQNEFEKYKEQYEKKDKNRGRFNDRTASRSEEEEGGNTPMASPQREENSDRERSPTPEREREKRERRRRRMLRRSREQQGRKQRDQGAEYNEDKDNYYENDQDRDNEYNNQWNDNDQYYSNEDNYNDNNQYHNEDYDEKLEEEPESNKMPPNLPKTQRKLFMRIQNQNKKAEERRKEDENRDEDYKEDNNWYSSDEESGNSPLNTIFQNVPGLNTLQPQPMPLMSQPIPPPLMPQPFQNLCPPQGPIMMNPMMSQPPPNMLRPPTNVPNVNMFDNIDLSTVTKILSTVRESIQKKNNESMPLGGPMLVQPPGPFGNAGALIGQNAQPGQINPLSGLMGTSAASMSSELAKQEQPSSSPQHNQFPEERRFRDPRLRGQEGKKSPTIKPQLPAPVLLTQADLDLRLSEPSPHPSSPQDSDIDLRHLPFKPAPLHQAAKEIDASIHSGPPVEYKLKLLTPFKPDYAAIASRSSPQTCTNDPRLRKYATAQVLAQSQMVVAQALPTGSRMMSPPQGINSPPQNHANSIRTEEVVVSRDPRNRGGLANDPRRRNQNTTSPLPQQQFGNAGPQPFGNIRLATSQPFGNPQQFSEQPHQDNDFRMGFASQLPQQNPFSMPNMADVDLRVQQPHFYQ